MRKILQIDGGGIMGIIPAIVLAEIETLLMAVHGKRLWQVFQLVAGTSTGAIIGGAIAAGVPAETIAKMYIERGRELFRARTLWNPGNWLSPKYDREPFIKEMLAATDFRGKNLEGRTLGALDTRLLVTAFNLCSGRTHFLKSWASKDDQIPLIDALTWSALSAAHFFGSVSAPAYAWDFCDQNGRPVRTVQGAVFCDGGQGYHNNTVGHVLHEIQAKRWAENGEKVYILSLGTGGLDHFIPPAKAQDIGYIGEIGEFLKNQARGESVMCQVLSGHHAAASNPNIQFQRISTTVRPAEFGLDKIESIDALVAYGRRLAWQHVRELTATLAAS